MNKTKIEWCDYTINPIKGLCPMACKDNQGKEYCYARRMYKRFKWNPEIRYIGRTELFNQVLSIPRDKPSRIFLGSTFELFGDWVEHYWMNDIFEVVNTFSFFTFILLTKQPQNLIKWSPFPDNCWVGITVTKGGIGQNSTGGICSFEDIEAKVKFVSFEPLLEQVDFQYYTDFVDWVIIGQQTPIKKATMVKKEWIDDIVDSADKVGIPVFLKDNLRPVLKTVYGDNLPMRQEFPKLAV